MRVVHDAAHAATPAGGGPKVKSDDAVGPSDTSTMLACLCRMPPTVISPCSSTFSLRAADCAPVRATTSAITDAPGAEAGAPLRRTGLAEVQAQVAHRVFEERDIERARELLADAGYPHGLDLELHTTAGRVGLQEAALSFQEMAAPAGITVEVVNHPVDAYWADIWLNRSFLVSNWSQRPSTDLTLSSAYLSDEPWNESRWSNERFDELVRLGRETVDEDERREIYAEAQAILAENGGSIISYFMSVLGAWSKRMRNYKLHPMRQVELHHVWMEEEI
jgi:ABC-type oligopeptide transport system substrate-binding subunit